MTLNSTTKPKKVAKKRSQARRRPSDKRLPNKLPTVKDLIYEPMGGCDPNVYA